MKNRSVSNSTRLKEIKKKKRTNIRNKFVVIFIAVVLLFGGLAYFSSLSKINIKNIEIVGSKVIDKEPILNLVTENISGKYMWLFPKTNFLIYPKNKIEERLVDSFHRMKDISFNLKDTETLEISFKEREPKYIWFGNFQ